MGSCTSKESQEKIQNIQKKTNHFMHHVFNQNTITDKEQPPMQTKKTGTIGDQLLLTVTTDQIVEYDYQFKQLQNPVFTDSKFPSGKDSISQDSKFLEDKVVWKRPQQFLKGRICIFQEIEPNDIKQGALGDCYFLSSLSALSEMPNLIKKLFITQSYQENGLYGVYMCHDGEFKQIALDDYFPCQEKGDGGPIFSKTNGNELWVLLLEKAYAKLFGRYDKIESGLAGHSLRDLTGAPFEYFIRGGETKVEADKCWDFISSYKQKKYLLAASSEYNPNVYQWHLIFIKGLESENVNGIISSHCYAILDAQQVIGGDGKTDRILYLRNPWGRKEWTGDWSDSSKKWTTNLVAQLKLQKVDDGCFWMSINDFITEFNQVCTCKVNSNYQYNSIRLLNIDVKQKITKRLVLMRVFQDTHAFISIHQKDKRSYAKEPSVNYSYSLARLMIGQIDERNQISKFIGSAMDNDREIVIEGQFEKGDYAVYIEFDWSQDFVRDIVLSCYGEVAVTFTEDPVNLDLNDQVLDGLLGSTKAIPDSKLNDYGQQITKTTGVRGGYLFFLYKNKSQTAVLKEEITMKTMTNLKICPPLINSAKFDVQVQPLNTQLVKYRVLPDGGGGYGYGISSQCLIIENLDDEQLTQRALDKPDKVDSRKQNEKPIEVTVSVYSYSGGVGLLYINKTEKVYKETLTLTLTNLSCKELDRENKITIVLSPNQQKIVNLKTVDYDVAVSYKMSMKYSLM